MRSYYVAQDRIKKFLEKRKAAPGADFFVETVAFYLKVAINILKLEYEVASEKPANNKLVAKYLKLLGKAQKLAKELGLRIGEGSTGGYPYFRPTKMELFPCQRR